MPHSDRNTAAPYDLSSARNCSANAEHERGPRATWHHGWVGPMSSFPMLSFQDFDAWLDHAYESGWTDGFPVGPPDRALLEEALDTVALDAGEVVGHSAQRGMTVTVADVAWF